MEAIISVFFAWWLVVGWLFPIRAVGYCYLKCTFHLCKLFAEKGIHEQHNRASVYDYILSCQVLILLLAGKWLHFCWCNCKNASVCFVWWCLICLGGSLEMKDATAVDGSWPCVTNHRCTRIHRTYCGHLQYCQKFCLPMYYNYMHFGQRWYMEQHDLGILYCFFCFFLSCDNFEKDKEYRQNKIQR